jgi:neutral ceramidase
MNKVLFFILLFFCFNLHAKYFYKVGFADRNLNPRKGIPLAGFGDKNRRIIPFDYQDKYPFSFFFKPAQGTLDPIRAKAMVVMDKGQKLLFLSLDFVGVTDDLYQDILKKIEPFGFNQFNTFISATHTHSGPGAMTRNFLWQIIAVDEFQESFYKDILHEILWTVSNAQMAAEKATLHTLNINMKGLQKNRRNKKNHFDSEARILMAKNSKGEWLGALVNFAIHGTAYGSTNLKYSADVPGAIERHLQDYLKSLNMVKFKTKVVFINGAEGDVSPSVTGKSGLTLIGEKFVKQVDENMFMLKELTQSWSLHRRSIDLGEPSLSLAACQNYPYNKRIYRLLKLKLGELLPRMANISFLQWGEMAFMTWPGEPTTNLGLSLKMMAKKNGFNNPWILGLTNGHLSYFTTAKEFKSGGYESCASFYGAKGSKKIIKNYTQLVESL